MATTDRIDLKERFSDGKTPTGADFSELIDEIRSATTVTSSTALPVSTDVAVEGTDTTGLVSPAGVKAHVDNRLATRGEAEAGTTHEKMMTPLRTRQAINQQVPSFRDTAIRAVRGRVNGAYDTLLKLYNYITNSFYNRAQSDDRYDKKMDSISGSRITSGINAVNVTVGKLPDSTLPLISNVQIASNARIDGSKLAPDYISAADFRYDGDVVANNRLPFVQRLAFRSDRIETIRYPVYLTHIGLEFLDANGGALGEFDQLAYRVYAHFFNGGDGSRMGGLSGDFIKFINAYTVFTGLSRNSTPVQSGLVSIPSNSGNVVYNSGSFLDTTPYSTDASFLARKPAIALLNVLNYGIGHEYDQASRRIQTGYRVNLFVKRVFSEAYAAPKLKLYFYGRWNRSNVNATPTASSPNHWSRTVDLSQYEHLT